MKSRYIQIATITIHGLLAIVLLYFAGILLIRQLIPTILNTAAMPATSVTVRFLFPTFLHILFSFMGTLPSIRLADTSRNEIERNLLPPIFFSLTLVDIFILAPYMAMANNGVAGFSLIGRIHVFALLFAMTLLLLIGLFHIGINTSRLLQFPVLALAGCLLVASSVPLSVALNPTEPALWYADRLFMMVPATIGILAAFTYYALYHREQSQHNLLRSISFMCIALGNILYVGRWGVVSVWLGLLLFTAGILLGIPRDRFAPLQ